MSNNYRSAQYASLRRSATDGITIREGARGDLEGLIRLAQLDSARLPEGPMIVAEVAGELRAALSLRTGHAIADPFHRTDELIEMLSTRAEALRLRNSGSIRPLGRSRWSGHPVTP